MRVFRLVSTLENRRVLRSACITQCKVRLNVELARTEEKYRLISYKIDELLQFACIWACFDVGEQACTTFCMHKAMQSAFKRRSILNGREISIHFLQNRRIIRVCVYLGLFQTTENACTTFGTHNAVQSAFKRRRISKGKENSLNFLQNQRIIAICVYLGLFRRWTRGVYYVLHA